MIRLVAVLVIAAVRPGLAPPRIMASTGKEPSNGICSNPARPWKRRASSLSSYLDKTGTITSGKTDGHGHCFLLEPVCRTEDALLKLGPPPKKGPSTPWGRPIVRHAQERGIVLQIRMIGGRAGGRGVEGGWTASGGGGPAGLDRAELGISLRAAGTHQRPSITGQ